MDIGKVLVRPDVNYLEHGTDCSSESGSFHTDQWVSCSFTAVHPQWGLWAASQGTGQAVLLREGAEPSSQRWEGSFRFCVTLADGGLRQVFHSGWVPARIQWPVSVLSAVAVRDQDERIRSLQWAHCPDSTSCVGG